MGDFSTAFESKNMDVGKKIEKFPSGIKVDHLLREFQNCTWGLALRQPFYLPLGLKDITPTFSCRIICRKY